MQNFTIENLEQNIDNGEQFNVYNTSFNVLTFKHCSSDELFFIGKQCADMLEYSDTADAIKKHILDENKCKLEYDYCIELMNLIPNEIKELDDSSRNSFKPGDSPGLKENRDNSYNSLNSKEIYKFNPNGAIFISEKGLYALILKSRKAEALQFQNKVYDILKEIRQTGGYGLAKTNDVNSQTLDAMSQTMSVMSQSLLTQTEILTDMSKMKSDILGLKDRLKDVIQKYVGSYTQAVSVNGASTVRGKQSYPTRSWNANTSIWTAIVNLGSYVHTLYIKSTKANTRIAELENKLNLEISGLRTNISKLGIENKKLKLELDGAILEYETFRTESNCKFITQEQKIDSSLTVNIEGLETKIKTLEQQIKNYEIGFFNPK